MKYDWRIHGIQEIEDNECVIICEDTADTVLNFFKILELKPDQEQFQAMDTAVADNRREGKHDEDDIETYSSLIVYQEKLEKYKQVGITLRKSGGIDFYYDFKLVETSAAIPGEREYVAVDMDFSNLHFKCYEYENK